MDNITLPIIDKINAIYGAFVVFISYILGDHWTLFAAYLALNVIDYISRMIASKINRKSNSAKGAKGIFKKIGYWLMICVAFMMSSVFIEIGETIGVDLHVTSILGWFVLAAFIVNEFRSIIENFVEAGYNVPKFLTKSLEVANRVLEDSENDGAG